MRAGVAKGTWITCPELSVFDLGSLLACGARTCLTSWPALSRNDTRYGLRADIGHNLPNSTRGHDAAVGGHPPRASVEDRLIQRAIGATVAPPSIHQARAHPSLRAAAVTAVAVHRAEDLRSDRHGPGIARERVRHFGRRRQATASRDMIGIPNGGRESVGALAAYHHHHNH